MNILLAITLAFWFTACASTPPGIDTQWWKGNLHIHSLWSDGTDYPEMIAAWYRDHGYNFLAITEHDMLQEGDDRWVDINASDEGWPPRNRSARAALPAYLERFGRQWVQQRVEGDRHLVRLRPLGEYRHMFEQPGRFMFIMSEEITDRQGAHVNAFNLSSAIKPQGGAHNPERIRNNLAAVAEQQRATGRPIVAVVNHPNYTWALKAEELAAIHEARLFEVYNGHLLVRNAGDAEHPSTEQMWDIILTARHEAGAPPIYGVAADDAHDYGATSDTISRPGRGWVMVRAPRLTTANIMSSLAAGDFYASTGVTLRDVWRQADRLRIEIAEQPGASYRTTFIGSRVGSDKTGEVLAEVDGLTAEYTFKGDERYVRGKVVSSRPHLDPIGGFRLGWQTAWTQPVFP